jgi:hypothetical protein
MITTGDAQWLMGASLTDDANELPLYLCNDPNGAATLAVAEDFEEPVPKLTEDNHTLWPPRDSILASAATPAAPPPMVLTGR